VSKAGIAPLLSSQVNFFRRGILSPAVINSRNHKQWHAINQALDLVSGGGDGGAGAQWGSGGACGSAGRGAEEHCAGIRRSRGSGLRFQEE